VRALEGAPIPRTPSGKLAVPGWRYRVSPGLPMEKLRVVCRRAPAIPTIRPEQYHLHRNRVGILSSQDT